MPSIEIATPNQYFEPPGRCIYCRRKSLKLTKEHIIPFGLAANSLVFGKASCVKCAKKTHAFETFCLRQMWWPFRTRLGIPSRNKEHPETFAIQHTVPKSFTDGWIEPLRSDVEHVPVSDFPLHYFAYHFAPPGVWSQR